MNDEFLVEKVKTAAANLASALNEASKEGIIFKVSTTSGWFQRGEIIYSQNDWHVTIEAHRVKLFK